MRKILGVFAHPDDETFFSGGTLAKYAHQGVSIHVLCATRGDAGDLHESIKREKTEIGTIRESELLKASSILGIQHVDFMDYKDGSLCNALYHEIAEKITRKIQAFRPDIIITFDRLGVSGHLDHIAMSMITTYAHRQTLVAKKLYYQCQNRDLHEVSMDEYFVYHPDGYTRKDITTEIDIAAFWPVKREAMMAHKSQESDVQRLLERYERQPKIDSFIRSYPVFMSKKKEADLFEGI